MRGITRGLAGGMVVVVGLTITAFAVPSAAGAGPAAPRAKAAGPPGATVTLITGDVVDVSTGPGGRQAATVVRGRTGMTYRTEIVDGDLSVLPLDALALIDSGVVDRRLFNLSLLLRLKYDDAHESEIPLLLAGGSAGVAARAKPVGGTDLRPLRTRKSEATTFWRQARGPSAGSRSMVAGVEKLWLDGKATVSLDRSRTQIGVPTAWSAGLTGSGVKVAVLDTGYDTRHPDLVGRVVASADFIGSAEGVEDTYGHGTHVASIVGGSGAASGGDYRGVAPDANLLIGKVCGDFGCPESAILAGMSWAVEQGAKVVNLSLGCSPRDCATDGSDPLARALDALSTQSGTLFVVSAGNDGRDEFVSTPAVADSALAVGSVDRQDFQSNFSNRGPRPGDFAVKPDITAPGEDIIAAKAAQAPPLGAPIGSEYQALSGTSMSAPHVAGAAAILAQQHPDWSGARLKAALMSTSQRLSYGNAFAQGAGRVDVARAVSSRVTADVGSVSFGNYPWPHTGQQPVSRTVTYRNDGDSPVTLNLNMSIVDSNWQPAADGVFQLDRTVVNVPAHGTAPVVMTFDPKAGLDLFNGHLSATGADDLVRLSTAVSARSEDERYNLTVTVRHRDGTLAKDCTGGLRALIRLDGFYEDVTRGNRCTDANGAVTIRTRPGHLVLAAAAFPLDENNWATSVSTVSFPDLHVTKDTAVEADARITKLVTSTVSGEPTARQSNGRLFWYVGDGSQFADEISGSPADYSGSVGPAADDFRVAYRATFAQPVVTLKLAGGDEYALGRAFGGGLLTGDRRTMLVNGGTGSAAELAAIKPAGNVVLVDPVGDPNPVFAALAAAGAIAAIVLDLSLPARVQPTTVAVLGTPYFDRKTMLARVANGPVAATTTGIRSSPYRYELIFTGRGRLPTGANYQANRSQLATVTSRFYRPGDEVVALAPAWVAVPDGPMVAGGTPRLLLPAEQQVYYTPGPFSWTSESVLGDYGDYTGARMVSPATTYQAKKTYTDSWYAGPVSPRLTGPFDANDYVPWAYRAGPAFGVNLPLLSDANSGHIGMAEPWRDYGYTTLSRDGVEVDYSPVPGQGFFVTEAGRATFQLRTEVVRDVPPFWTLGTKVSSTWTFTTDPSNEELEALPLLDVDWRLPVDLTNRLPAGRSIDGELVVGQQRDSAPKKIAGVSVQVSFDAGVTWRSAAVNRAGDSWRVRLPGGGVPGGQAALRVKAVASDGTAVEETIERAYALK